MKFESKLRAMSKEPIEHAAMRLTLATGGGKTLTMLALWEYLMADDDPADYADSVQATDEELEAGLAAIKSQEPTPLPADIEALGGGDQAEEAKRPSSPSVPTRKQHLMPAERGGVPLSHVSKLSMRRSGPPKKNRDATWREQVRAAFDGSRRLPYERFYWHAERKNWRDDDPLYMLDLKGMLDDLWQEWSSLRREEGDRAFDPYDKHIRRLPDVPMCDCRKRPPGLPPWPRRRVENSREYLLALLVLPGTQDGPRRPAWFTCEEAAVRQVPELTVAQGRWSVVVNVNPDVAAARELAVQAIALELPETLDAGHTGRQEDIRRLWETHWRDGVLQHLGSD